MVSLPYECADDSRGMMSWRVFCRSGHKDRVSLYSPGKRVVPNRMPGPRDQPASFLPNGQYGSQSILIGVHLGAGGR